MERIQDGIKVENEEKIVSSISSNSTLLTSGFGSVGYPKRIPSSLSKNKKDLSLTVISSGTVGEEIDVDMIQSGIIERRYPYISSPEARSAVNSGKIQLHDPHASSFGDKILYGGNGNYIKKSSEKISIIEAIAVGEGWLIPSTSVGHTPSFIKASDRLIVEINESQPLELRHLHDIYTRNKPPERDSIPISSADQRIGGPKIYFDSNKLDSVVKTDKKDTQAYNFEKPNKTDKKIADNLTDFLSKEKKENPIFEDKIHLEFGAGRLGNALMEAINSLRLKCDIIYFGEVIQDGLLDSLDSGNLEVASGTSLTLSSKGQKRLFENIEKYSSDLILRPVYITNSPSLIERLGVIAVNSAIEIDIYGNVNSTHISGTDMVTGIGGSGDFNRNSHLSIVAIPSTASGGDISRVVPFASHIDHTEHDIDVIVTENGIADIRGLSPKERSKSIIECAHPKYQDDLFEYLKRSGEGHINHNLDQAFDRY